MPARQPLGSKPCERCGVTITRRRTQSIVAFDAIRFCGAACRNRARIKAPARLSLSQFAVLSILASLEEQGAPPVARLIAERYYALRGDELPIRRDGLPNVSGITKVLATLEKHGVVQHHRGQGNRGAYRITPLGRQVVSERSSVSILPEGVARKLVRPPKPVDSPLSRIRRLLNSDSR